MRLFRRAAALFLCVCIVCLITRSGLLDGLGQGRAAGAAYFSAMLAMPEGVSAAVMGLEDDEPYIPDPNVVEAPVLSDSASSVQSAASYTADPADAQGKILKKFISPYTAKLNWNKIYVRNMTS